MHFDKLEVICVSVTVLLEYLVVNFEIAWLLNKFCVTFVLLGYGSEVIG